MTIQKHIDEHVFNTKTNRIMFKLGSYLFKYHTFEGSKSVVRLRLNSFYRLILNKTQIMTIKKPVKILASSFHYFLTIKQRLALLGW